MLPIMCSIINNNSKVMPTIITVKFVSILCSNIKTKTDPVFFRLVFRSSCG